MTKGNLSLWELVEKTDPKQTTAITGKPYKGTSPKPYFIVHEATKVFGPCGIGWGFSIVSERVENGGKEGDKLHIAHIRVWYEWDGKRGEIEHVGQTMFSGTNKNGLYTDEDAPKKSVTDALIKALSMIGFAGDIFMGRYDDSKYVKELRNEFDDAGAPDTSELLFAAEATLRAAATEGSESLKAAWLRLDADLKPALKTLLDQTLKPLAAQKEKAA